MADPLTAAWQQLSSAWPVQGGQGSYLQPQAPMPYGAMAMPQQSGLAAAHAALNLSPQEQALYQQHLTNLYGQGGVDNKDGSRSTLYQAVQEHNGKFYNIPTVWNGKREVEPYTTSDGTKMDVPNQTSLANVAKAGWNNFPSYNTPDEADARYDAMHKYMEQDTANYMKQAQPAQSPLQAYGAQ